MVVGELDLCGINNVLVVYLNELVPGEVTENGDDNEQTSCKNYKDYGASALSEGEDQKECANNQSCVECEAEKHVSLVLAFHFLRNGKFRIVSFVHGCILQIM